MSLYHESHQGTPKTMSKLTSYESNTNDDLVEFVIDPKLGQQGDLEVSTDSKNLLNGVSRELSLQMFKAMAKGVKNGRSLLILVLDLQKFATKLGYYPSRIILQEILNPA